MVTVAPTKQQPQTAAEIAWIRLMRVYHLIDARSSERMKAHCISLSRFDVLNHAGLREGRTQQELANALMVTKGNITQLLDGMEHDGLLVRRRSGRRNLIYLTDTGRDLRSITTQDQLHNIEEAFAALTPDDVTSLSAILRKLDRSLTAANQTRKTT